VNRRPAPSIVANPVLVGAATVLVVIVGVFLAYNANNGLPFVPTYEINARVPDAAELVPGNDVRIGGKRVGVVDQITALKLRGGKVAANLHLKLEKSIEPLRTDTKLTIRPRSTLGLKYIQLQPGHGPHKLAAGGTLAESQSQPIVELDEALNTFDTQVRKGIGDVTTTLADGLAGRGADLNEALHSLDPLVTHLEPVMRVLRSPQADLTGFIDGLRAAAVTVEPVAGQANGLIDGITTTFDAVNRATDGLRESLDRLPDTEAVGTRALHVVRPVLQDSAALARDLRPGADLLERGTRRLADVVQTGTPVLKRATTLGPDLERTLDAIGTLSRDPVTSQTITELTGLVSTLGGTLQEVNPMQTTCNYLGLWTRNASSVVSEGDTTGNWFRFIAVAQVSEMLQRATPAPQLHDTTYGVANATECEVGNEPYVPGQVIGHPAGIQPAHTEATTIPAGVSHTP
jgi:virulence factor Mce-like protein